MQFRAFVLAAGLAALGAAGTRVSAQTSSSPDWTSLRDETLRHFRRCCASIPATLRATSIS
jgi:hypothetical protein